MRMFWITALAIIAICAFAGIFLLPSLPSQMVIHWGIQGEPNGWMDTNLAIFTLPALMLVLALLLDFMPRIDPRHKHNEAFSSVYEQFIIVMLLFMAALHFTTLAWALGTTIPPFAVVSVGLAVLMIFIGRLCSSSQPNYFIGIRTPWALEDNENWKATNRLGAKLYYWAAPLCLLGLLLPGYTLYFILAAALIPACTAMAYSYLYYAKKKKEKTKNRRKKK